MRRGAELAAGAVVVAGGVALAGLAGRAAEHRRVRELETALEPTPPRGRFDESRLAGLPEPARRYLAHAIEPGAPLHTTVRLRMAGTMRPRPGAPRFAFRAEELLVDGTGFLWDARGHAGPVVLRVTDHLVAGRGAVHVALCGAFPMTTASGPDVARSSAHRLAAEHIWMPTALVPGPRVRWEAVDESRARVIVAVGAEQVPVTLEVAGTGRLESLSMERHGDVGGSGWGPTPYGMALESETTFDGCTIPTRLRGGWWYGTGRHDPDDASTLEVRDARGGAR